MKKSLKMVAAATVLSTFALNLGLVNAQTWTPRSSQEVRTSLSTGDGVYVIQWGDTLSTIAEATGHSVESLAVINEIADVNFIRAGAVLYFNESNDTVAYVEPGQTTPKTYELSETNQEATYVVAETAEWVAEETQTAEVVTEVVTVVEEVTEIPVTEAAVVEEVTETSVVQAPSVEETSAEVVTEAPVVEEVTETSVTQAPAVEETSAEVVTETPVVEEVTEAPVTQAPVVEETTVAAPASSGTNQYGGIVSEAKEWIAMKESGGSYTISNPTGQYYGRYQLTISYLNGDLSPENQERVADEYVLNRYGSWEAAKAFWEKNNWY